jgi:uncharacterized protein DUF4156
LHDTRFAVGTRVAALLGVALLAGACTWVKLTAGGEGVHVGTMAEVSACKRLGATHAKTSPRVLIFSRGTKSVERDLENLARNEAGDMGGDTIVPQGPTSSEGRRSFDVYRCR